MYCRQNSVYGFYNSARKKYVANIVENGILLNDKPYNK